MTLSRTVFRGTPQRHLPLWGEEEQCNERAFRACTETSDMKFVTTRKVVVRWQMISV